MSEKHLYIDFSHICHRNIFALAPDIKANGFGIFRHALIKSVLTIVERFEPQKVFICCDAPRNWRKKFYEPYKAHRAAAKSQFDIDWKQFYETIEEVKSGFKESFPFYVLQVDWLEADDIISFLTRKHVNDEKIIISSDSDFVQLMRYPNTKIFCPLKDSFIKCDNPMFQLELKIVKGDKNSDNIPSIGPRIGPVTAEKLIESGDIENILENRTLVTEVKADPKQMRENYIRNKKLIDLTKTPSALIENLEKEYQNTKPAASKGVYQYIVKHKLRDLFYKVDKIDRIMRTLNPSECDTPASLSQLEQ